MEKAYLQTGSNLGDRLAALDKARILLNGEVGPIVESSSIYETEPWGFTSQDMFLNQVLVLETSLAPDELLDRILALERLMGRNRSGESYTSRIIDIDILFYDEITLHAKNLIIPHRHIEDRMFTLVPLAELAPDFVHPVLKMTMRELLLECKDTLLVRIYQPASFQ